MLNACIHEHIALGNKAVLFIEPDYADLGMKEQLFMADASCMLNYSGQQLRADTFAAISLEYCHASYLPLGCEAGRGNRHGIDCSEKVNAGNIVPVPFKIFWDMLFVDKDRFANALKGTTPVMPVDNMDLKFFTH